MNTNAKMWTESRLKSGLPPLKTRSNFVLVNDDTFEEFEKFKSMHINPNLCYIHTSDDIDLYFIQTKTDPSLSTKFNVAYYLLTYSEVDAIIEWLYNTDILKKVMVYSLRNSVILKFFTLLIKFTYNYSNFLCTLYVDG